MKSILQLKIIKMENSYSRAETWCSHRTVGILLIGGQVELVKFLSDDYILFQTQKETYF